MGWLDTHSLDWDGMKRVVVLTSSATDGPAGDGNGLYLRLGRLSSSRSCTVMAKYSLSLSWTGQDDRGMRAPKPEARMRTRRTL